MGRKAELKALRMELAETKASTALSGTLAVPGDELFALFTGMVGGGTAAGEAVGPTSAMKVPAVAACIRVISETLGSLDLLVMKREADGTSQEDPGHAVNTLLARPNGWTSRYTMIVQLVQDACRYGMGAIYANRVDGEVRELIRLRPGTGYQTTVNLDTGEPSYRVGERDLTWRDVACVQPVPSDGEELLSLIHLCRESIGLVLVMQRHGSKLFANSARPGGILSLKPTTPNGGISPTVAKNTAAVWNAAFSGDSAGKTAVLPSDASYTSLALNSVDAQFAELWKRAILDIIGVFRVPPSYIGDLERTTHSNAEELGIQFVSGTMNPWAELVTGGLERVLFTDEEIASGYYLKFNFDDLQRPNMLQLYDALSKATAGAGFLTADEARDVTGKGPLPGGSKLYRPLNAVPADAPIAPTPEPAP